MNVIVLPFATNTPDRNDRNLDVGVKLALLIKLETLFEISQYRSIGVTLLSGNEFDCDAERVPP